MFVVGLCGCGGSGGAAIREGGGRKETHNTKKIARSPKGVADRKDVLPDLERRAVADRHGAQRLGAVLGQRELQHGDVLGRVDADDAPAAPDAKQP